MCGKACVPDARDQRNDSGTLPMMRANFDEGLVDIGQRLTGKFGGRIVERYVDET
jgi:hypothetical protein